ncbi:hypothetical protein KEJ48_01725 [Candidatus Bathyarchaeota archaeon]|nr:hypothetical protein [Candidatus Bathyarchaeota archaeon]MBS7618260.1 hypothetical protein [Candidatus Bathyarchaeota archaeon]
MENLREKFKCCLFLSSMMGITDGGFCAERGVGTALVQLGAYLAEPPMYGVLEPGLILPPEKKRCVEFLAGEVEKVKKKLNVAVCLNLATLKLEWGLEAAECFREAGGDFVELNVHGGYRRYLEQGKLKAMVLPENRNELFNWLKGFSELNIPTIVKFRAGVIPDYTPVLDRIVGIDIFGVHFNVRDDASKRPDVEFVREIKSRYSSIFLLVSGYVRSAEDAIMLFNAGADMVGIAEPTIKDPDYIANIAEGLKTSKLKGGLQALP